MRLRIHAGRFLVAVPLLLVLTLGCQQAPEPKGPNIGATVAAAIQTALPPTPTPNIPLTVEAQVQEKLAAIPTPTPTSVPPTPTPTPTPVPPTLTPVPPTPTPTIKSIVDQLRPAVVRIETGLSTGSGFIVQVGWPTPQHSTTALVLTNNHVIEGASWVQVVVNDHSRFDAEVWGADPGNDIALLKICCGTFEALEWADQSEISEGDLAIAMGYPLGIPGKASVTVGVISAERYEYGQWVIQTDAAINPGNSGGPLISSSGKVLGINTRKEFYSSDGRPVDGLGFAVSLKTIQSILESLKSGYMKPVPTPTWTPVPPPTATPTPIPPSATQNQATWYISEIQADIKSLKFYETAQGGTERSDRKYQYLFDGSTARYISWELNLTYPKLLEDHPFDIEWVYYLDGIRKGGTSYATKPLKGWRGSYHGNGWGNNIAGRVWGDWNDSGTYVAKYFVGGVLVAQGEFEVY
jgi:S1-C subfamily serine protease